MGCKATRGCGGPHEQNGRCQDNSFTSRIFLGGYENSIRFEWQCSLHTVDHSTSGSPMGQFPSSITHFFCPINSNSAKFSLDIQKEHGTRIETAYIEVGESIPYAALKIDLSISYSAS